MKCPYCGSNKIKVVDKRDSENSARRRRECNSCNKRFTTYERIENLSLMILKKNGTKEQFNKEKLKKGVLKACEKRPITLERIEKLCEEVELALMNSGDLEIESSRIGELVMEKLKIIDKIAYLRFASVYHMFDDIRSFEREIDNLSKMKNQRLAPPKKIRKRDGRIVPYNKSKIVEAIWGAAESVGGKDKNLSRRLADKVESELSLKYIDGGIPSVEEIQDTVEKVLIETGHVTTAKSYILYRDTHKKIREIKNAFIDVNDTISEYLNKIDWRVKENSNTDYSFSGLMLHTAGKVIANYTLNNIYMPSIREAHVKGYIHIHDLSCGVIGYCAGWSLKNLLLMGFGNVPNKVDTYPAKHLDVVVGQMVNFIGCLQMEFAGAQAFSNVDTLLAPFVRADKLSYRKVKQQMQKLIYNLNIPSRWGSQYPFSNLTFDWVCPPEMKDEKAIVGGRKMPYTYGELQKEMDIINKAFIEIMLHGDAKGRVFTFPIPTYNLYKDFDWESENALLLFELTAKYGSPYFQNYIGSDLDPQAIKAMCCRLNLNMKELVRRAGHSFAMGDSTGSIGVITINVNRIAYESETRAGFFDELKRYMLLARNALEIKRKIIGKNLEGGLMPYTKVYLGSFRNYFSTIGVCGMNEACVNFLGKGIVSPEGKQFAVDTLIFMREMLKRFQVETNNLYNLEATPAESTAYRFARLDKKYHPDIYTAGGDGAPYLTNSTHMPVSETEDLVYALRHQSDIQTLYTGGTIFHVFLGERLPDAESCRNLVKKIAFNTKMPYFNITPTFSICPVHGYITGEHFTCPFPGAVEAHVEVVKTPVKASKGGELIE